MSGILFWVQPYHSVGHDVRLRLKYQRNQDVQDQVGDFFGVNRDQTRAVEQVIQNRDGWCYEFSGGKTFPAKWFDPRFRVPWGVIITSIVFLVGLVVTIIAALLQRPDFLPFSRSTPTAVVSEIEETPGIMPSVSVSEDVTASVRMPDLDVLWTEEETIAEEDSASMIFVATSDFFWEFNDPAWRERIFRNLLSGNVRYYQLYESTDPNEDKLKQIICDLENSELGTAWQDVVHYIPVEENDFIWYAEHVFYDPYGRYGDEAHAIVISLVHERLESFNSNINLIDLNVLLSQEAAIMFRGQFEEFWNSRVEDEYWRLPPMDLATPEPDSRVEQCELP